MRIAVPRQAEDGEARVALVPSVVKRLTAAGHEVLIERGAGARAYFSDASYREAGARVVDEAPRLWAEADAVLVVHAPRLEQVRWMRGGALLAGVLGASTNLELVEALRDGGITAFAMELIPRISRAQSMDVLSSQASIAGYKAVIMAAERGRGVLPMMITPAGTISPARVLVIGAGVAGLQAIATARRLGAVVDAYDVRAATREQVQSLGARFVQLNDEPAADAETHGGYAREQSERQQQRQAELMARTVTAADIVICTAAVLGAAPPLLVPTSVVEQMQPGSVLVDLAADPRHGRGNCQATRPGEIHVTANAAQIVGTLNLPALVPRDASLCFAHNMHALLEAITDAEASLRVNLDDEIQASACITHEAAIRHERLCQAREARP